MSDTSAAPPLPRSLNVRLSTMMFLQYAIWGAWLPFLWSFLAAHRGMSGEQIGQMFAAGAVGAILGPMIFGPLADRLVPTERLLALCHGIGAVLIWRMASVESFDAFRLHALIYGLVYMPTLPLTNSLALGHLPNRDRDFGRVRLWGTLGWIAVGLFMGQWLRLQHTPEGSEAAVLAAQAAGKADAFRLSAVLGLLMAGYCLTLPHTPPSRAAEKNPATAALGAAARQPLLTLFLLAVPVSCIHQFYFVHTESFLAAKQVAAPEWSKAIFGAGGGGVMTVGQMSEVAVLAIVPLLVARGTTRKTLLGLGLLAYAARMALFAYVDVLPLPTSLTLLLGVALHGFCFGCFIFVSFMIVDEQTAPDIRASAQNLYNLVIVGIGVIVGSMIATGLGDWAKGGAEAIDYGRLFQVPMAAALVCWLLLLVFYPGGKRPVVEP